MKKDGDLPRGVYRKHGAYYRVHKNVWYRLGTTYREAEQFGFWPPSIKGLSERQVRGLATKLLTRCRNNTKLRRPMEFTLTVDDVIDLMREARWVCAVTGIGFTQDSINGRKPYAPSIDRIDNAKGYTRENCRIVCTAVNIAMNVWGEDVLSVIGRAHLRKVKDRSPSRQVSTPSLEEPHGY